jgi:hypothetical protein
VLARYRNDGSPQDAGEFSFLKHHEDNSRLGLSLPPEIHPVPEHQSEWFYGFSWLQVSRLPSLLEFGFLPLKLIVLLFSLLFTSSDL